MSRQRKQKLKVREEGKEEEVVSKSVILFPFSGNSSYQSMRRSICLRKGNQSYAKVGMRRGVEDPFLPGVGDISPPSLSPTSSYVGAPSFTPLTFSSPLSFGSPSIRNFIDSSGIPFPPTPSPSQCQLASPISNLLNEFPNQEEFQELKVTSTPKWKQFDRPSIKSSIRKKIPFGETPPRVLTDITASLNTSSGHFVSLESDFERSESGFIEDGTLAYPLIPDEGVENMVKRVPIIRKNIVKKQAVTAYHDVSKSTQILQKEIPSSWNNISEADKVKIEYYTGLEVFDVAESVLKNIAVPTEKGLTQLEVQIMTLMRLRLNLEFKDISLRFNVDENVVVRIFSRALGALAGALRCRLPWQERTDPCTPSPCVVFLHPFYFRHDFVKQIIVCYTEKEVLFVSSPQEKGSEINAWWRDELKERLRPGDDLIFEGRGWRVGLGGSLVPLSSSSSSPLHLPALHSSLTKYQMFNGKFRSNPTIASWVVIVIAALVNSATSNCPG